MKYGLGLFTLLCIAIAVWAVSMEGAIAPDTFTLAEVSQVLTILFFVALLIERALEVIVQTWRQPGRAMYDVNIKRLSKEITRITELPDTVAREATLTSLSEELRPLKQDLEIYRSTTRKQSLRIGLIISLLVAAAGVRTLAMLVEPDAIAELEGLQGSLFILVDVVLTAGLLAGGSKGIHALTQVFGNYLDTMAENAKT